MKVQWLWSVGIRMLVALAVVFVNLAGATSVAAAAAQDVGLVDDTT